MDISNAKRIFVGGATVLVISALIVGAWTRLLPAKNPDLEKAFTKQQRSKTKATVADTLTLDEVRKMIVGTWIEDVDGDIGSYRKGDLKWVFTEDGMVRKYRDGSRYATQEYAVVGTYDGQQAPEDIAGYLRFTDQDGEVNHMTLSSIRRDDTFPHLSVGTHEMAGNTETLFFVPARVFE
jgi:serine/threonine-protein kinase RIO1